MKHLHYSAETKAALDTAFENSALTPVVLHYEDMDADEFLEVEGVGLRRPETDPAFYAQVKYPNTFVGSIWHGPFGTEDDAAKYLIDNYGLGAPGYVPDIVDNEADVDNDDDASYVDGIDEDENVEGDEGDEGEAVTDAA